MSVMQISFLFFYSTNRNGSQKSRSEAIIQLNVKHTYCTVVRERQQEMERERQRFEEAI